MKRCPSCAAAVEPDDGFCSSCGTRLRTPSSLSASLPPWPPPEAEIVDLPAPVRRSTTQDRLRAEQRQRTPTPREMAGSTEPGEHGPLRLRARHRFEAGEPSLGPFVGRQAELAALRERWRAVERGRGAAVLVRADAGVGKSGLVRAFEAALRERPHGLRKACGVPLLAGSALHPWAELVRVESGIDRDDDPRAALDLVQAWLERQPSAPIDALPLLAGLLGVPLAAGHEAVGLSPQARRLRTIAVLVELLLPLPEGPPALVVIEDLQWADPSTLELLELLVARLSERPALLLMTARPELASPWDGDARVHELPLRPLDDDDTRALVLALTPGLRLPPWRLSQLVERSAGNPLFVKALARLPLDAGPPEDAAASPLPATLHDALVACLDRLDPLARRVAQLGATIDRSFRISLVRRIFAGTEGELRRGVDELVDAQLVRRSSPDALVFEHALVQEVAYASLLDRTRREHHDRIAQALAQGFGHLAEVEPERLAHHLEGAGVARREDAVRTWLRAGERAQASAASQEAVSHLRRGLALVSELPASPQRVELELRLLTALGASLSALDGHAAHEVEQAWLRADALCEQLGPTPARFGVLWRLWAFYLLQGAHSEGLRHAERMLELAAERRALELELEAHFAVGLSCFFMGDDLPRAHEHLEWVVERHDGARHHGQAQLTGQDVGITSRSIAALVCFQLGLLGQALQRHEEALELSAQSKHALDRAQALGCAAWLELYLRDPERAQGHADEAVALSQEQSHHRWLVWGTILGGSARADRGEAGAGDPIEQWLARWRQTGAKLMVPCFLGLLASARRSEGALDAAEQLVHEARAAAEQSGERFFEAELRRLEGELLLARGEDGDALARAEAMLRGAMDTARAQGAKAWVLRAAVSLARVLEPRGRGEEARQILADALAPLEGQPETPELAEARALARAGEP